MRSYNLLRVVAVGMMTGSLVACFQAQNTSLPPGARAAPFIQRSASGVSENPEGAKGPRYSILDLGTLGGDFSFATGLNNHGWVAGSAYVAGNQYSHAVLWRKRVMTDIGSSFGTLNSFTTDAAPINDEGAVAGILDTSLPDPNGEDFCALGDQNVCLPFVWRDGAATLLPLPGGNNGLTNQISNQGEIVGVGEEGQPDSTCVPPQVLDQVAVVWGPRKNEIRELPPYGEDTEASAIGVNDKGEVVGTSGKCKFWTQSFGAIEAILWRNGRPINLGNLGFRLFNQAFSINNKSEITGQASTRRTCCSGFHLFHAYLWRHGTMKDLGVLPGDVVSLGNSINDKSQIVGLSETPSADRGFLWQDGTMYDFNALIPRHARFNVLETLGINNRGQVAGWGIPGNTSYLHGFLATPCDGQNPDHKGCQDERGTSTSIALPENARRTLMRWNALHHIYGPTNIQP